jgi:hypothetical protein
MSDSDLDEIKEIFGLKAKVDEGDTSDIYNGNDSQQVDEPFDKKVEDLSKALEQVEGIDEIKKITPKHEEAILESMKSAKEMTEKQPSIDSDLGIGEELVEDIHDVLEVPDQIKQESEIVETQKIDMPSVVPVAPVQETIVSSTPLVTENKEVVTENKEVAVVLSGDFFDEPDNSGKHDDEGNDLSVPSVPVVAPANNVKDSDLPTGEITWITQPPAAMYDTFYQHKINVIKHCCTDGNYAIQIPFSKYKKELFDSKVDISVITFDPRDIHIKMQQIQNLRTRATQIHVEIIYQYCLWKRAIQLLRGVLARTEIMRPVMKQEGVNYEHLFDAEMYFAALEATHDIAEKIVKNLDCAYELLSRQVTIVMPQKPMERYASSTLPKAEPPKKIPETMKDFDDLGDNIKVEKEKETSKGVQQFFLG